MTFNMPVSLIFNKCCVLLHTIHITWFYVVSNSYFFNLFNNNTMYILQMISKISSLISQMFFHAVLLKSHCQNHIQANGISTATILCNFNTPSLLLVFSVYHISLYMQWNTCSCLCTSSTCGTPHSVQLSCFIYPVPLLPVTIFSMMPHTWKTPITLSCPSFCLSARISVAPTRQIYMKYDIGDFS